MNGMSRKIFFLLFMTLAVCIVSECAFGQKPVFGERFRGREPIPEVRLLEPVTESVDLSGKKELNFRWSPHEGDPVRRDYYDFRLYNGRDMVEGNLIRKERVPKSDSSFSVSADTFEVGKTYTWSMRQIYTGSIKSRRSYSSFTVIKK